MRAHDADKVSLFQGKKKVSFAHAFLVFLCDHCENAELIVFIRSQRCTPSRTESWQKVWRITCLRPGCPCLKWNPITSPHWHINLPSLLFLINQVEQNLSSWIFRHPLKVVPNAERKSHAKNFGTSNFRQWGQRTYAQIVCQLARAWKQFIRRTYDIHHETTNKQGRKTSIR